jgi:hypothetical protein
VNVKLAVVKLSNTLLAVYIQVTFMQTQLQGGIAFTFNAVNGDTGLAQLMWLDNGSAFGYGTFIMDILIFTKVRLN